MANLFDATNAPTNEPLEIQSGDFIQWKRTDLGRDYPNDEYQLKYSARLNGSGDTEIEITATNSDDDYLVQIASSVSNLYATGVYLWQAYIVRTSDSERVKVGEGNWTVLANRDEDNSDPRTVAEINLEKIEARLSGRLDSDVSSYSIGGRSLTKIPLEELRVMRDYWKAEVIRERNERAIKEGRKTRSTVQVRFS